MTKIPLYLNSSLITQKGIFFFLFTSDELSYQFFFSFFSSKGIFFLILHETIAQITPYYVIQIYNQIITGTSLHQILYSTA